MIKISKIMKSERYCSCDHCNVEGQPFYLKYEFIDNPKREEPYVELTLCEDCSCMMSKLHFDCMKDGDSYQYDVEVGDTKSKKNSEFQNLMESYAKDINNLSLANW